MVTHETYKSAEGQWLSPDDVEMRDGQLVEIATGAPASAGRVEKMSKSKKNVIDPSPIIDQYGADAEIGRAAGRERVCQYVYISVVGGSLKKKTHEERKL